ncbi:MAG: imelysin family protein [Bdellovibrionales bacterium]|nr:imelysin family protein [Bdellovibrionales bacterium]
MKSNPLKINFVLASSAMLVLLSCSEFSNQKKDGPVQQTKPPVTTPQGQNPFPEGFDPNSGEFSESKMIASIGLNVIAPAVSRLRIETELMINEIDAAFSRFREGNGAHNELLAAQEAWRNVMLSYHFLEGAPIGLLSDVTFRQSIYSWPGSNLCGIDKQVVARVESAGTPVASLLYTMKGLLAIEYLLFESSLETECNPRAITSKEAVEWTKKSDSSKRTDRLKFASQLAKDLLVQVQKLEAYWSPTGANFTKSMVDGSAYPTLKDATTALSDSLFSIEIAKDRRLGKPLGLHKDCLNVEKKCPEDIEHLWSKISFQAIDAQLSGLEAVFFGRSKSLEGFGFDDFLKSLGRADVVEHFQAMFNGIRAQSKVAQAAGTLEELVLGMDVDKCKQTTIQNKLVPACALFQEVRQLNIKLKTEFLAALSLRAPPSYQGDSD